MRTWLRVLGGGCILLACSSGAAPPTEAGAVFDDLQAAWARGDVRGVVEHLGERKISLALPELATTAGTFSRSQSRFILESHFARTRTLQFQFLDVHVPTGTRGVAVALAVRRSRAAGAGPIRQDRILVTLAPEGSRWVIAEITALP